MDYCQSTLPIVACIGMNIMTYSPALVCLFSAIFIAKKKSYIFELKQKQEFEDNTQLIERSKINLMVKQILTIISCLVCLVFLIIYLQEPTVSIVILNFYAIQVLISIVSVFLLQAEYKRQGSTSSIHISNYVMNFFLQAGMGVIIKLEHTVDTHCFALLIILQAVSLLTVSCVILQRVDFTKEAEMMQSSLHQSIRHKSTAITNNLLDQSYDYNSLIYVKEQQAKKDNLPITNSSNFKKTHRQSLDINSFIESSVADSQNVSISDINAFKRRQSANYTSSRSDTGDVREILQNRLTPSFNQQHSAHQSTVSNSEDEPKNYLYAYRDIKVIGYKAKDNQMLFVISYFRGIKSYKTDRSHRDFKYLGQNLSLELINSSFTLPQLPKRIQKTGALDKSILKDKMTKYNRFLYYIEYNKIDSKEFSEFLLPNKERPSYAPKNDVDNESFISTQSPPESVSNSQRNSLKLSPQTAPKTKSPSSFSNQRYSSDTLTRSKAETIANLPNSDTSNSKSMYDFDDVQLNKNSPEQCVINIIEASSSQQPLVENTVKQNQEDLKKDTAPKNSTLSTSTQASSPNRYRSQTTQENNKKGSEQNSFAFSSRQYEENNQLSFLTQSERQSVESQIEERQPSAQSEGQEPQLNIQKQSSKNSNNYQSLTNNSNSQAQTNITSSLQMKSQDFSFSQKGFIEYSAENIFFKPSSPELPMIIIPQTKEISGKTFYEVQFYINNKKTHNFDKRYNHFKEFHLTIKSELKKTNQTSILPELPYKPSKGSQLNLVEYRKSQLAKYLTEIQKVPVIYNSQIYKKFIEMNN